MRDGVALAAEGGADLAGSARALCDGGEDVVVQGVLGDAGVFAQQMLGFRGGVDRPARIEQGPCHPRVEVGVGIRAAGEGTVTSGAAQDRVDPERGEGIVDLPEPPAHTEVEGAEA